MANANINQAPKGTQDILPEISHKWQYVEQMAAETAQIFGYEEIRVPTFEHTAVFTGSVGETTDIVQKEMYTFEDKGGHSLTLRPEATAGVVRSVIQHGLLNSALPQKVYYITTCFRRERPQAGRYREFRQFGVESFGSNDPSADAEIICLAQDLLTTLGINEVELLINSIGCAECRAKYLEALKEYFTQYKEQLDEDSRRRLDTNPMRILDSKIPETTQLVKGAPQTLDYLCSDCKEHFEGVKSRLDLLGVNYRITPTLVRGLDYYTNTVFEFVSSKIGAQGTVCGGGRYNLLVERRGGKPTPALGFGMGLDRILLVMAQLNCDFPDPRTCDIYIGSVGDPAAKKAFYLASKLRSEGFAASFDLMSRSVKAQMKYANKIGAKFSMIIGEDELAKGQGLLKNMSTGEETQIPLDDSLQEHLYNSQIMAAMQELSDAVEGGADPLPPIFHG